MTKKQAEILVRWLSDGRGIDELVRCDARTIVDWLKSQGLATISGGDQFLILQGTFREAVERYYSRGII